MSWFTKLFKLDNTRSLQAINAVGNTVLAAVEANNPKLQPVIDTVTTIGNNMPTTTAGAVNDAVHLITVIDPAQLPKIEAAILTAFNKVLTDAGVPAKSQAELDALLIKEFEAVNSGQPLVNAADGKAILQGVVDVALEAAKLELVGEVNKAIDEAHLPAEAAVFVKTVADVPILAFTVKI